jgi:hippurate hydrolase
MPIVFVALTLFLAVPACAAEPALPGLDVAYPAFEALYLDLHRNPELSLREERTAAKLAEILRSNGFEATEKVGGTGVVGVLRNGAGPTLLIRTDMDALPIEERTGLPYASVAKGVMHACGHDVHMTAWAGAATLLAGMKDRWKGTLVMIAQPAEEIGAGARAMLDDGLYTQFPKPEFAIAFHASGELPAGTIGWKTGPVLASADSVDVTFHGKGTHGATPHLGIDPIAIAARFVLAVQTLVSRENDPLDPAVVTVGSFHAGTKHNIIPDEAKLQMTVRAFRQEVRERLLAGIERMARAEAAAAGAPEPAITVSQGTRPTANDPALANRLAAALKRSLGEDRVVEFPPVMAAEDFSAYAREGVATAIFWLGTANPEKSRAARSGGLPVPGLHSAEFAPDPEPTLRTGATALVLEALELLR